MSTRTILIGLLAVVAGGAAAIGARQFIRQFEVDDVETRPVVTMAFDVPRGERIGREQLTTEEWPVDRVPEEAVGNVDDVAGRVALVPLFKGQPVHENLLASPDVQAGLASLVPEGMRAFTIHTPTIASGVAGFLLPGNIVDVLLTVSGTRATGGGITLTLLQQVEILAVDEVLDAPGKARVDARSLSSVTLLVTPAQAEKLSLAQNKGTLELALRNPEDKKPVITSAITVAELQYLGEIPQEPEETEEERVARLVAERLAEREVDQQAVQAEREQMLKEEMRLAFEEKLQLEMDRAREDMADAVAAARKTPVVAAKPRLPTVLTIRTLRGSHGGVVLVKPGSAKPDESMDARDVQ